MVPSISHTGLPRDASFSEVYPSLGMQIKPNLDYNYPFPINLATNGLPFGTLATNGLPFCTKPIEKL